MYYDAFCIIISEMSTCMIVWNKVNYVYTYPSFRTGAESVDIVCILLYQTIATSAVHIAEIKTESYGWL